MNNLMSWKLNKLNDFDISDFSSNLKDKFKSFF